MEPIKFYEKYAVEYAKNASIPEPIAFSGTWGSKTRIQLAYEMLAPYAPFDSFFDVGCGNLSNLVTLQNLFNKGFGIDIVAYPTWKLLEDKLSTYQHNLNSESLPFPNEMFDAVTILMVLEHVFDPFTVIEEISRVTKVKGYLVINVPNIAYIKHRLGLLVGKLPITSTVKCWEMREWDGGHIHYFTLERLTWLLNKFGNYQVLQVQGSGKLGKLKRLLPGVLCSDLQILCQKVGG
ncbi:class I SAM-dependent methyltransferase [Coleofasciculus sp. FACHB-1120]|uniref:class I SAM-dependent methyltransferase n=1 Tax=Coleofasciculus sp. FACHB-1120 TaxID=2692783 RepID=UPI0016838FD2|nr:class I SAM-dependent methyltransferase [Coleofasciculus sp. FACHB-1120]MBD2743505.1 class I SAM-dependent methyltransferase [Coleofasciculus sp. FACHB-1120]